MCIFCIANNINRNVYMYLITRIFLLLVTPECCYSCLKSESKEERVQNVYFSLHTVLLIPRLYLRSSLTKGRSHYSQLISLAMALSTARIRRLVLAFTDHPCDRYKLYRMLNNGKKACFAKQ